MTTFDPGYDPLQDVSAPTQQYDPNYVPDTGYVDTNNYSAPTQSNTTNSGGEPYSQGDSVWGPNAYAGNDQPKYTFDSVIAALLQPDNIKTVLGATIMGSMGGISSFLTSRSKSKADKELWATKWAHDDQTIRDKVTRASAIPEIKRLTKDNTGKTPSTGWKSPGLIASSRQP